MVAACPASRTRGLETAILEDRYDKGLEVRRRVLGDAHVDRSLKARDELTHDMQQCITEFAWGTIWSRPGLACAIAA